MPHVHHVIQADFASNIVHHLHRTGRASRGGSIGFATNFFDERSLDLVKSMLRISNSNSSVEDSTWSRNIEQSFSRRRGFRHSIKKAKKRSQPNEVV